jgi:hypothetical protein
MKTKIVKANSELTVVEQLRLVRDKINEEIKDLSPKEILEYIKSQHTLHPISVWQTER